jgi:hypothetical protein
MEQWRRILGGGGAQLTDRDISAIAGCLRRAALGGLLRPRAGYSAGRGGPVEHVENEHVFCVNRIVEDPNAGAVAVATANGLVLFDRDGRQKQVLDAMRA